MESQPPREKTITWSGACVSGIAEGRGVAQWFQGGKPVGRYEGTLRDDRENGGDVYNYAGGARYEGEFRGGNFNGRGVYTSANGNRYEGEWRDDGPNGSGTARIGSDTYNGTWTNGCFRQGDRRAWWAATEAECGFR